jgi:hypothetical protein
MWKGVEIGIGVYCALVVGLFAFQRRLMYFQAAEHRPTGNNGHRPDRKALMAGSLSAWGIDQPKLRTIPDLAVRAFVPFGNQQTGKDVGIAQQPLEALVRRRVLAARMGLKALCPMIRQ